MSYLERINALLPTVRESLAGKLLRLRLSGNLVDFELPHRRPRTRPGAARSEFLANRAMGDWAEDTLATSLRGILPEFRVLKYGNADRIVAGDAAFPEFFDRYHGELGLSGKRPDLLVCDPAELPGDLPDDIADFDPTALARIVPNASAAIEVRSSKYRALKYAAQRAGTVRRGMRTVQSFTPKIEDLRLVVRWIRRHGVPHFYAQVFFDVVYMIPTERILEILAGGAGRFTVEENRNNQDKPTIHIPVTEGAEIGRFERVPQFEAETRETPDGRIDAFVVPDDGSLVLDDRTVRRVLGLS